jgi:hypothetical protein
MTLVIAASGAPAKALTAGAYQLSVPCDLNLDGVVDAEDLNALLSVYGATGDESADINGDGVVNSDDLTHILAAWSSTPVVSLQHVTGDFERRTIAVDDVLEIERSPFYSGWTRLWVRLPFTNRAAIDVPLSLASTKSVLQSRGWTAPVY